MASMELGLDFCRTLDTLKWAPKVWRSERHGMRKAQSDPCFTSTFTKLPEILAKRSRPGDTRQRGQSNSPSRMQNQGSSSSKRLLAGMSTQTGFHNQDKVPFIASSQVADVRDRRSSRATSFSCKHRPSLLLHHEEVVEQAKDFSETVENVHSCITLIHKSLERFEGHKQRYNRSSIGLGGSQECLSHQDNHPVVGVKAEEPEDEGQSLKARLLQYRYVKKIEVPAEPLYPLESDFDTVVDDGELVHHNTSSAAIKGYSRATKMQRLAERSKLRDQKIAVAQGRKLEEEQRKESAALLKVLQYEDRISSLSMRQGTIMRQESSGPERAIHARRWQGALVMIGFFQIIHKVVGRFKDARASYAEHIKEEGLHMSPRQSIGLGAYVGVHLLSCAFVDVARKHFRDEKLEWRLPPKLRSIWCVQAKYEDRDIELETADGSPKRKVTIRVKSKMQPEMALEDRRPLAKADSRRGAFDQACGQEGRRVIYVEVPQRQDILRLQQNVVFLEAMLTARLRLRRRRREARKVTHALQHWSIRAKPFIAMLAHIRRVKQIQRFFRWSLHRLAEARARVEENWKRLEAGIAKEEAGHHCHSSGQDFANTPQRSRHAHREPSAAVLGEEEASHHDHHSRTLHHSKSSFLDVSGRHGTKRVCIDQKDISHSQSEPLVGHRQSDLHMGHPQAREASKSHIVARHSNATSGPTASHAPSLLLGKERRRVLIAKELRKRRKKWLPVYEVWRSDMNSFWRDVKNWRTHYKDCKRRGVKNESLIGQPSWPPCPSHLPSDEDLLEVVRRALTKKPELDAVQRPVVAQGRVARLAVADAAAQIKKPQKKKEEHFKATEAEEGHDLCDEVTSLLAPTAFMCECPGSLPVVVKAVNSKTQNPGAAGPVGNRPALPSPF